MIETCLGQVNGVKVGDSKAGLAKGIYVLRLRNDTVKISIKD